MDVIIKLIALGSTRDDDLYTEVYASLQPVTRAEFSAAGQAGYHTLRRFDVWSSEYADQEEVLYEGRRLTVYRVYGPKPDGRSELYTAERVGNRG